MSDTLEFTGERFTPECVREIRYEHMHRYVFASRLVPGLDVLDAACGEGYGSALLARAAARVTGVDLSAQSIGHARVRYGSDRLRFEAADCTAMPFPDRSFDCIVSFETLEHLEDHDALLREFRRLLKPDGFLLISTPDKAIYSEREGNRNEFHVKELYRNEFEALVRAHFPALRLWGQKLLFHSAIWSLDESSSVTFSRETDGDPAPPAPAPPHDPVYLLALCAANEQALPSHPPGLDLFDDAVESVYAHYHHEIRKNMAAGALLAERDRQIERLRLELEAGRPASPAPQSWWRRLLRGRRETR